MIQQVTSIKTSANGTVFYTAMLDDGKNFRGSVIPGQSLENYHPEVVDFCNQTWDQKVISDYRESLNK
jgi:hypothetical protein